MFRPFKAETEIALVTTFLTVNQMSISVFHGPTTQGNEPQISQARAQKEAVYPPLVPQMGGFQVKAPSLQVTVEGVDPGPAAIETQDGALAVAVGDQEPPSGPDAPFPPGSRQ